MTVKELSSLTTLKVNDMLKVLMGQGQMVSINETLDENQRVEFELHQLGDGRALAEGLRLIESAPA